MVKIRFKKKENEPCKVEVNNTTYDNPSGQSVLYRETIRQRLLKRQEMEKVAKDLRQRLLKLNFRARIQIKGSGLIIEKLRLRQPKPYLKPYQNSNYRVRDEFGVFWADDLRNGEIKKVKKSKLLQNREWDFFREVLIDLAFGNSLVGRYKVGSQKHYNF
jgi:hypothetical protein